ncbi:GNAT family N-acetyltransferase [Agrobacterium sp. ES01]|uniref:GNAT family N-acetyltransferase n=1 Tax=Agrobacterium sp. ES01 TaxID=3420714 RepID=UPI003D11526C
MPAGMVRRATPDDIPFIMATERMPGYEKTVGRFEEATHLRQIDDPTFLYLVGADLGFAIFTDLDDHFGNACLRRFAVTAPAKGYGSRLLPIVLDHAFKEHDTIHRIWLRLVAGNKAAIALYEKTGFVHEGVQRQAGTKPGIGRFDFVQMSILRPEWQAGA